MSLLLEKLEAALRGVEGEVELSALESRQGTTRFANSRVTQTGDVMDVAVQARVALGRRVGAARTNRLASINEVIARARELAEAQPESQFAGFDDGKLPVPGAAPSYDETTARADASERAQLVAPAFAATARHHLSAAGLALTSTNEAAVATTAGSRRAWRWTASRLDVIAADGDASARVGGFSTAISHILATELAERACERAARSRDPIDVEPGVWDVILEPPAVTEMLEWLALTSLSARTVEDGSSCLAGCAGEKIAGRATFYDDALSGEDGCPTLPFDSEGTPKQRVVFIEEGVARGPAHDRAAGARAQVPSTGHAAPIGDEVFEGGPGPTHLQLGGGSATLDQLVSQVERGLYVARFHYVNGLIDTRRALMTGMTRDGLFLIENGRVGRAVRNLRWTESLLDALGRCDGMSQAREVVASGLSESVSVAPSLLVRGWRFTGKSR
jgi:predicted Zn-dependent protease